MTEPYDVIVVGARCAGSPTAMLLARRGHRVLVVDRATFPSDTMSTHMIHAPGVAALRRWGLDGRVAATGCPPITTYSFDFGDFSLIGSPRPVEGNAVAYAPRRTVLDAILVDAAAEAGAEIREGFTVDGLLTEDGRVVGIRGHDRNGTRATERAAVVVGADGIHSLVAEAVDAPRYNEHPTLEAGYYAYWRGVPSTGFEVWIRPERSFATIATNDGLTCLVVTWPRSELVANRADVEGNYMRTLDLAPELAARVAAGERVTRIVGTGHLPNFYRRPYGPGWALVGDAGYHKDPCTAQGISDGFRDAGLLAGGLGEVLAGRALFDDAMAAYQRTRDEATSAMFELTLEFASLEPPPPEMAELLHASAGNQEAMDGFAGMIAGTLPVPEFLGPDNRARIMAGAAV
jgi:2-polyprenyl-6-methoxyphenol hydroxylase-like FAD-dependent oxidoreductase